ncbi:AAA family ATPase [Aurantimonas sp. C2-6-R+9]|uniref:AAA family ATPase n=1 Tax=unclassified Aurantimonas TaxID=2638230 RepID=UPI002E198EC6|nr:MULTISPECIES: AAA family ATPase [unclassified Aurantimonas]MEC5289960.1 AAA family ATPase [Aurantimonas sp. C2-3-R2]MEC5381182.1 AAA family ATPase [Aurantimonas sp. C2-6-R+9]MEC5411025.1 AAA family ATPase [Aurantimonas sp. C2-4-R8]
MAKKASQPIVRVVGKRRIPDDRVHLLPAPLDEDDIDLGASKAANGLLLPTEFVCLQLLADLPGRIAHRIEAKETACILVRVSNDRWAIPIEAGFAEAIGISGYPVRGVSIENGRRLAEHPGHDLGNVLDMLRCGHTILYLKPDEVLDPVFKPLVDAEFDLRRIKPSLMTAALERAFPGSGAAWPRRLDAAAMSPRKIDFAFKRAGNPGEVIALVEAMKAHQAAFDTWMRREEKKENKEQTGWRSSKALSPIDVLHPTEPRLEDLAGYGAAADWCRDLIADIDGYRNGGVAWADVDRGCLLVGPPGTGKTMLASALAASAGMPMIATSYAQWQSSGEAHMGTLVKAMRATFAEAEKHTPCIVFIDEIDAIPKRGSASAGRHDDWWTAIVTALLECLDGTSRTEGIVTIAACNNDDNLDPALVRSGRLDRRFEIGLPDADALTKIIRHHLPEADLDDIAPVATSLAGSASGADVARFVREAKRAARRRREPVTGRDLMAAALPPETRGREIVWRTAVHEAGHAVAFLATGTVPGCLSIVHGRGMNGYVQSDIAPSEGRLGDIERYVLPILGGRAAEEIVLGEASAGARQDLQQASVALANAAGSFGLGGYLTPGDADRGDVEHAVRRLYSEALMTAHRHRIAIVDLARLAIEKRVLGEAALRAFGQERGLL